MQNITLALAVKALFLTLTLMGYGTMWMAVFADAGASLLVVGNGLRLLRTPALGARRTARCSDFEHPVNSLFTNVTCHPFSR